MDGMLGEDHRAVAEKIIRKQAQLFCKGAKMELINDQGFLKPKNLGCENLRRHGSAWCQECSDKHKNATL